MKDRFVRLRFQEVFLLKKKPFSELVIGLACIALGVAVFIAAGSLQQVKLGIGPAGMPRFVAVLLMVLGLAHGLALFIMLPTFIAKGIDYLAGGAVSAIPFVASLIEGLVRIAIFVTYVWAVSLMPDIRRTYEYHGAEHKSVFCFEAGLALTPENARKMSRLHPRCGTSFIFVMLIISIILNTFLSWENVWLRFGSKILMLPLIV